MTDQALLPDEPIEIPAAVPLEALVLKVLSGRVAGALLPLPLGETATLGHGFDADIVLRDASARGVSVRLTAGEEAAEIEVLSGQVEMLGHRLEAPARAVLPCYVPLIVGDNALALGVEESPRWREAERLLTTAAPADPATPEAETFAEDGASLLRRALDRGVEVVGRTPHLVPALVFGAALACVTYAVANVPQFRGREASPSKVHALLRQEGYGALAVQPEENGKLVIAGVLNRDAEKARLTRLVSSRELPARVEVVTSESLAQNVEDVFQANGLAATARPNGLARVQVQVTGPAEDVAKVEKIALHDVKGLRGLAVERAGGGDRFGQVFDQGPGKRVVSVVGGEAGYVATADGARYFAGSMLPTGDRIIGVESQAVLVEKNGETTRLMF
ncbi:SctD/MshK family protein [Caulobacter hibisci]|uniref:Type III secretion apparatus protein, YscD/HrpQ family n=1 Tax=Caulobacter hibisci TaxID=2035993 RepID=A0ABS0SVK8_9CAUL|nr:hypothetical protein [Caulobacter hibisci]MBI1682723.1 hypothetical protein [Caulobacter hibisci]